MAVTEGRASFSRDMISVRLLGVVAVTISGKPVDLGPKTKILAAALLYTPGHQVSFDALIRRVYEEDGYGSKDSLQSLMRDLRKSFDRTWPGASAILATIDGTAYKADVEPGQVDVRRFLLGLKSADAAKQTDPARAAAFYREALQEWPGNDLVQPDEPLADIRNRWADGVRRELLTRHRQALHRLLVTQADLGQHAQALPLLARLVALNPSDQEAVATHMIALYRDKQRTEAMAVYQRLCAHLRKEHGGAMPDDRLQQLNQQIVNQDPALNLPVLKTHRSNGEEPGELTDHSTSTQSNDDRSCSPGDRDPLVTAPAQQPEPAQQVNQQFGTVDGRGANFGIRNG